MASALHVLIQLSVVAFLLLLPSQHPPPPPAAPLSASALLRGRMERHRSDIEAVMAAHGPARLTAATWEAAPGPAPAPPLPIFFLTAAAAWGRSPPEEVAAREAQYAANIGAILALGFRVLLAVSPGPPGARDAFPLAAELAAAAAPGQLRVHRCSQGTRVKERSGGPDELLCMQEAILALFEGCVSGGGPPHAAAEGAVGCPGAGAHVVRMSGRYLMAKHGLLAAVRARGAAVDAFVKWSSEDWVEAEAQGEAARKVDPAWRPLRKRQVLTFFLSMRVRGRREPAPSPQHTLASPPPPLRHGAPAHTGAPPARTRAFREPRSSSTLWTAT